MPEWLCCLQYWCCVALPWSNFAHRVLPKAAPPASGKGHFLQTHCRWTHHPSRHVCLSVRKCLSVHAQLRSCVCVCVCVCFFLVCVRSVWNILAGALIFVHECKIQRHSATHALVTVSVWPNSLHPRGSNIMEAFAMKLVTEASDLAQLLQPQGPTIDLTFKATDANDVFSATAADLSPGREYSLDLDSSTAAGSVGHVDLGDLARPVSDTEDFGCSTELGDNELVVVPDETPVKELEPEGEKPAIGIQPPEDLGGPSAATEPTDLMTGAEHESDQCSEHKVIGLWCNACAQGNWFLWYLESAFIFDV